MPTSNRFRRLMKRIPDVAPGTGTGPYGPRPLYVTTRCETLYDGERRRMLKFTGEYAGTGTGVNGPRPVYEFAECTHWQYWTGTGSGPFHEFDPDHNPGGFVFEPLCCPGAQMPRYLYLTLKHLSGPCNIFDGYQWLMRYQQFGYPTACSNGAGQPVFEGYGTIAGPTYGGASLCCIRNGLYAGAWFLNFTPDGRIPGGPVAPACSYSIGRPNWQQPANPNQYGIWGQFYKPAVTCDRPFSFCKYFVVYPDASVAGLGIPSCCPTISGGSLYRAMVWEPGGQAVCGGSGPNTFDFTGTGTGSHAPPPDGADIGPWTNEERRNRDLMKYSRVSASGRRVYVKTCCETGTGTTHLKETDPNLEPGLANCCAGYFFPTTLTAVVTVTALAGDECGLDRTVRLTKLNDAFYSGTYSGTNTNTGDPHLWVIHLWCTGTDFWLTLFDLYGSGCTTLPQQVTTVSCDPIDLQVNTSVGTGSCLCLAQISVVITE